MVGDLLYLQRFRYGRSVAIAIAVKESGFNSVAISITRFLHVDFPKCRCRRFRLLVQRSVIGTHEVFEGEEVVIDQLWSRRSCEVAWL